MAGAQVVLAAHNADEYRHAIERMAPMHYLAADYYERVFTGAVTLLVEKGTLDLDDLTTRAGGQFPLALPTADDPVIATAPQPTARFEVGDRVRVRDASPRGHTRVPRYCRGKEGVVLHVAPAFARPETSAHGGESQPEHTYHVEFTAEMLWDTTSTDSVVVDLWDSSLEAGQL